MIWFLRLLFGGVLVAMLWVTTRASLEQAVFAIPAEVTGNPWFLATLFDAYFAFLAFYVWVAWKEPKLAARILWFIAIMAWGNIAMALYMLRELSRIRDASELRRLWGEPNEGRLAMPAILTGLGVGAYLLGAGNLFS